MFLNILSDTGKNAVQCFFLFALFISLSTILPAFVPNGVVGVCSVSGSPVHHTHTIHSHTLSPFSLLLTQTCTFMACVRKLEKTHTQPELHTEKVKLRSNSFYLNRAINGSKLKCAIDLSWL